MIIGISTKRYYHAAPLVVDAEPDSEILSNARRMTRTPTLDRGVEITDQGFCAGDQTLRITCRRMTEPQIALYRAIADNYTRVTVATPKGTYECVPERYNLLPSTQTLTFAVVRRLDAGQT